MTIKLIHRANLRGTSSLGWLHTRHSFSFGSYVAADNIHFGALRVLNDEMLAPGKGYGNHPHSNMEIITLPLVGSIEYKDDKNNHAIITKGDIQILSAGTGIFHTEKNPNKDSAAQHLKIWILPHLLNITPQYQNKNFEVAENNILEIIGPTTENNRLSINQSAWINIGKISTSNYCLNYSLHQPKTHGVYIFVIKGELEINNETLLTRDGIGITETENIEISSLSTADFLLIEIPLKV
jgi:redox-sensitive bicupin YhaK (pirin superfamily)